MVAARCWSFRSSRGQLEQPAHGVQQFPHFNKIAMFKPTRLLPVLLNTKLAAPSIPIQRLVDFTRSNNTQSSRPSGFDALAHSPTKPFSLHMYQDLAKAKLSSLVLLTTVASYAIAPGPFVLSTFVGVTVGTALCIASANTLNQWIEHPYDAQMARTKNRVLVRKDLSNTHVFLFGTTMGVVGTAILAVVNPWCAALGGANILLYTCVYTPMKRSTTYNTWAGSIVGAVPPVIGQCLLICDLQTPRVLQC